MTAESGDVLPVHAFDYQGNHPPGNTKTSGQGCIGLAVGVTTANFHHLCTGELGFMVSLSNERASLGDHIGSIVSCRAKKHVIGIDAGRIIASVTHEQVGADWTAKKLPCEAMRLGCFPVGDSEVPISTSRSAAFPCPAVTGFVYLSPKTGFDFFGDTDMLACSGAVLSSSFHPAFMCAEFLGTDETFQSHHLRQIVP